VRNLKLDDEAAYSPQSSQLFTTRQASSSSIVISITSGRAFYLYGLGGMFLTSIPAPSDLYDIVVDSMETKADNGDEQEEGSVR